MSESVSLGERLDSWKAIAQYLKRDLATARRWEKSLGLPVHRVGPRGRSVFAYRREIDEWLSDARPVLAPLDVSASPAAPPVHIARHRWRKFKTSGGVLATGAIGFLAWILWTPSSDLRIEVTNREVVARNHAGVEKWRYLFPATFDTGRLADMVQVARGTQSGVYVATRVRGTREDQQVESGALVFLNMEGRAQRAFSFNDRVTFDDKTYGPPWALTDFAVQNGPGKYRVAIAAHHYVWDPGLVTILNGRWQRHGTFVNAGWVESVNWLTPDRLLIAGYSNAHDGGMISLLDAADLDGQSPEPAGSPDFCMNCGTSKPLRMFVFPRTEINRIAGAPFNRAVVQTLTAGRVTARTIEMTSPQGDGDALYEFTAPALNFVGARFSDRYWELHRRLESEGKIAHTRENCPDRDGPREILEWDSKAGWRTVAIRERPETARLN